MIAVLVTLEHLQEIARRGALTVTVDAVKHIAYLRVGRTKYYAPLAEDVAS